MTSDKMEFSQENRMAKWDNVKFVLILLVVLGHVAKGFMEKSEGIGKIVYFIYLFHMPTFIFISGLFSKRTVNQKRWDKIVQLLVVFYFMKVLICIVKYFTGRPPVFSLLNEYGIAWYVLGIVFFMLITMAVKRYSPCLVLGLSILIGCFVGYDKSVGSFLALSRVVTFYPFFALGYYLDIERLGTFLKRKLVIAVSAVWLLIISGIIVKYYNQIKWSYDYFLKGKGNFELQFKNCPWTDAVDNAWLLRLGYYFIVFLTVLAVVALIPSIKCVFSRLGSRTLQVYVLHETFIYLFLTVLGGRAYLSSLDMKLAFVLISAFSLCLTIILSTRLFTPLFSWLTVGKLRKKEKQ